MKLKLTYILILLSMTIFLLELSTDRSIIFDAYGFSQANLINKPYVLLTSIFLHADLGHLLANMLVLLFFGLAIEEEIGWRKMLVIFFIGAFAGDLLSLAFYPADTVSIGASAGIFAIVGLGILVKPFDWSFYPFVLPVPLGILGILYAIYTAVGFAAGIGTISYAGHFGGLLVGLAFGVRHTGWHRGIKTVLILLAIMIAIPLAWLAIGSLFR